MNQKSAKSDKKSSAGFIGLPVLLIVMIATLAITAKSIYNKSHVLGQSTMLAQEGGAPPAQGAPSQPQEQTSQPQGQPQQPQQNNQPQQPSQNNPGPQPQQMQPGQQNPQVNPQNYQQYMQKSPEEQKQMQQQYNQGSQQQFGKEQNQQGGQNPNEQTHPGNNPQQQYQMTPQQQQQYRQYQQMNPQQQQQMNQQMQQQWQQEATKNGFQINGNIPAQYFQQQATQGKEPVNQSTFQALPSPKDFATINGEFKVKSADGTSVDINDGNTRIQLGSNNSNLSLNAIRPDGKRIEIDKKAFEAVVAAMKAETGSEVSQKGDTFTFKRGTVEADTKFPISFDVTTKAFSVQTSNGEQEVKVLPDQAVQKLMENKVFSQLQSNTNSNSAVTLTELDNKPVYQVQGTIQKKFLGFVPWSNSKTTYVSADNGEIVKTDASAFSKLLDIISF